jgi:hypothetical protein
MPATVDQMRRMAPRGAWLRIESLPVVPYSYAVLRPFSLGNEWNEGE